MQTDFSDMEYELLDMVATGSFNRAISFETMPAATDNLLFSRKGAWVSKDSLFSSIR